MDKDRVKGTMDDAAGRVKRQVGEWTGDSELQAEGASPASKGQGGKCLGQDQGRRPRRRGQGHRQTSGKRKPQRRAGQEGRSAAKRCRLIPAANSKPKGARTWAPFGSCSHLGNVLGSCQGTARNFHQRRHGDHGTVVSFVGQLHGNLAMITNNKRTPEKSDSVISVPPW